MLQHNSLRAYCGARAESEKFQSRSTCSTRAVHRTRPKLPIRTNRIRSVFCHTSHLYLTRQWWFIVTQWKKYRFERRAKKMYNVQVARGVSYIAFTYIFHLRTFILSFPSVQNSLFRLPDRKESLSAASSSIES